MTPYEQGYAQTMEKLGLDKAAGYFQNIVGIDDPSQIQKLRDAGADYNEDPEATRQYYDAQRDRSLAERQVLHSQLGAQPAMRVPATSFWGKLLGRKEPNPEWAEWSKRRDALHREYAAAHPFEENLDVRGRARLIGGTPYGNMAKYTEFPEMISTGEGAGYLTKEELLHRLEGLLGDAGQINDARLEAVKNSPHQYFTSTEAG